MGRATIKLDYVTVIGAGLAGSEAAWQLARRGVRVKLWEMRPEKSTPAHQTDFFAELVCSNSLRGASLENAVGLLKEEMRRLGSLIMDCAGRSSVPAGGALAVDREIFGACVTRALEEHPLVEIVRREVTAIPGEGIVILATGPLTSEAMAGAIREVAGEEYLYFYDAVAPIVTLESVDMERAFFASRYNKGDGVYLNCPMNREQYIIFREALAGAERAPRKHFEEKEINFEGCMPVEVLAKRGVDTLRYGPLKPVGITNPDTGERYYAVVQLRQDNKEGTLYNLVGFQTHLKWKEQDRVLKLIPGLEEAEIVRYGVMHRNTYINSPSLLEPSYSVKELPGLFFAGQITGVEGYVESASSGLVAGINAARRFRGEEPVVFPPETAHGALSHYITTADKKGFQPMNVTFGLFPPLEVYIKDKKARNGMYAERALQAIEGLRGL